MIFKNGGWRKNSKKNSSEYFNKKLSVYEKSKIKYAEERRIHLVFNYYGISKPSIRYWRKGRINLLLKKIAFLNYIKAN